MRIKDVRGVEPEIDLGEVGLAEVIPQRGLLEIQCLRGYSVQLSENEAIAIIAAWEAEYPSKRK